MWSTAFGDGKHDVSDSNFTEDFQESRKGPLYTIHWHLEIGGKNLVLETKRDLLDPQAAEP